MIFHALYYKTTAQIILFANTDRYEIQNFTCAPQLGKWTGRKAAESANSFPQAVNIARAGRTRLGITYITHSACAHEDEPPLMLLYRCSRESTAGVFPRTEHLMLFPPNGPFGARYATTRD